MNELLRWLLANGFSAAVLVAAFTMLFVVLAAYIQGRAVSFWPPRIEGKPLRLTAGADGSTGVMDAVRSRKSVRAFSDRPVEDEKLKLILEAARLAPSASNRQEWRFVVVRDPEIRKKITSAASSTVAFVGKAPVLIVACAESDDHVMQCGQLSYPIDVAIALNHITLAAVASGLGTCWVAMFEEPKVREILGIPEKIRVMALMPLGYPADPSPVEKRRLSMDRIVRYEHW
jgi:nitroreductase